MMIEQLYQLYSKDVYYYIYSLCNDQTLSEDLTSETFYQVMLSLPSFKEKSDIKTWIFSIARNVSYKEFRKRKVEVSLDDIPELIQKQENHLLVKEINELIEKLPVLNQKVFYMRLDGYSYEEIAFILTLNVNSVRVINHRNKKYLKEIIERSKRDEDKL